ncbi:MAG: hypothetical protein K6U12_01175 [Armatimonadetes bacterium]|nr:hypothetical protein [Armatimonadota bacterium]CUU36931.1 hypothetical protein DCOP10_11987 [Armatimonadetes bacterium DC]
MRWILWSFALTLLVGALGGCAKPAEDSGAAATPPPTTNPLGQAAPADTPGAAAEERKASGN